MYPRIIKALLPKRMPHAMGLVAMLGLLPAMAFASPPQGEWRGMIKQANTDVAVQVSFHGQAADFHFNAPFTCDVPAWFVKDDGFSNVYSFAASKHGGRFCDELLGRKLTFFMASQGRLTTAFDSANAKWHGVLSQP
ncbi:hypothetical protein [Pinirhizobacter sp.]|jgi:hypothetical protein|uniref:hypothetical protein n=1 Tax=Pinirhizobacter sp. TaxID=2950432 RepID=UPI002F3EC435